jgi:murein DD-endopeptidase MepM/ murein hydrolase activator NlpD
MRLTVLSSILYFLAANCPALDLRLPTANDALLKGGGEDYFQFVDRNFEGQISYPWEGGQFGFWRDPRRIANGIAYARFHEGMDVKPLERDARGDPLDEVRAILAGEVVHVAPTGKSNYGSYIVIRHDWGEGPFYSLYAHLKETTVSLGMLVSAGQAIARMGYTGSGIDQRRAHVHVELNVMLSSQFDVWHSTGFRTPNHHGIYNGMNLLGLDLQALYLAHAKDPALSVAAWMKRQEAWFEITVPASARLELLQTHPWLREATATSAPAWQIRCTRWGLPIAIKPAPEAVSSPILSWLKTSDIPHYYATRGLISNSGKITVEGMRFVQLMAGL